MKKIKISTIVLLMCASFIFAQEMSVPVNLQAALFKKIFSFNKSISGTPKVLVVFTDASAGVKDQVLAAFKEAGFDVTSAKDAGGAGAGSVVYICPGVASPKAVTSKVGALSISGVGAYAENGTVAVALGTEGGKPKIIVNLTQLKAEKQDLSADLLKMAKVIQ